MKIYLSSFDIFKHNAEYIGFKYKNFCEKYNIELLYPKDSEILLEDTMNHKEKAQIIFENNKKMIQESDCLIANFNYFNQKEDLGTIWECGYAYALNKKIYIYKENEKDFNNFLFYQNDLDNEDLNMINFNFEYNLMIQLSAIIIKGQFEDVIEHIVKTKIK